MYRNKLTHLKELSKQNYFKNIINTSKNGTKLLWKTITDIVKHRRKHSNYTEEFCNEVGQKITNDYEMGNMFNKYLQKLTLK